MGAAAGDAPAALSTREPHSVNPGAAATAATDTSSSATASAPTVPRPLPGTFSGYFQKLHATQQMVLVGGGPISGGAGPCTPNDAHGYPEV